MNCLQGNGRREYAGSRPHCGPVELHPACQPGEPEDGQQLHVASGVSDLLCLLGGVHHLLQQPSPGLHHDTTC